LQIQIVFLAFIAAIALATFDGAQRQARASGNVTIQIMPDGDAPSSAEVAAALSRLRSMPEVISATVMSREENAALLQPFLPSDADTDALPLPALIDVKLGAGSKPDVTALRTRLLADAPHAVVIGGDSLNRGAFGMDRSAGFAIVVLGAVTLCFVLSFASATRAQLWIQRDALDLLQILGATNRRVAWVFAQRPSLAALSAALIGTVLGAGTMVVAAAPQMIGLRMMPLLSPIERLYLLTLAFIPVAVAAAAWVTARLLVQSALRS
jgi:cell division transport system permease protein